MPPVAGGGRPGVFDGGRSDGGGGSTKRKPVPRISPLGTGMGGGWARIAVVGLGFSVSSSAECWTVVGEVVRIVGSTSVEKKAQVRLFNYGICT